MSETKRAALEPHLEVTLIKQYGREEYRAENETAQTFLSLLGQKVLTRRNIENIKQLGYRVILKGGEL